MKEMRVNILSDASPELKEQIKALANEYLGYALEAFQKEEAKWVEKVTAEGWECNEDGPLKGCYKNPATGVWHCPGNQHGDAYGNRMLGRACALGELILDDSEIWDDV
jgi:hypothetical protein